MKLIDKFISKSWNIAMSFQVFLGKIRLKDEKLEWKIEWSNYSKILRFKVVYKCVLELCQTPRMRLSGFLVNKYFCQSFIVNVWQGFRYISKYVLAHFFRLWKIIRSFKFKTNNSSNNNIENSRPFLPFFILKTTTIKFPDIFITSIHSILLVYFVLKRRTKNFQKWDIHWSHLLQKS